MPGMSEEKTHLRLTESLPGRLAGWLLAVLWIFSMSGVDCHALSSYPVFVVLAVVLLLVGGAILAGKRLVQMSVTGWLSLAAGGYFLMRCLHSYSVVDSWCETGLILGAFVYYVAGVYVAQSQSYRGVLVTLVVALVLNLFVFWAARQPWFNLEWTGRAPQTPAGANSMPFSLFVYKNFAAVFFCVAGGLVGAWASWCEKGALRLVLLLVSAAAVVCSLCCSSRAVFLVLPASAALFWGLHFIRQMLCSERLGKGTLVSGFILLVMLGLGVYEFLFGSWFVEFVSNTDSHLRYKIWGAVCEVLPAAPLWGFGANATQWEIIPYYSEFSRPNYAHNEYLQTWCDYGIPGILLLVCLLAGHLLRGGFGMSSEFVTKERQVLIINAMVAVACVALYALYDFPWHSFALVALSAFACGILASPVAGRCRGGVLARWRGLHKGQFIAVRAQKRMGKLLLLAGIAALLCIACSLAGKVQPAWLAQWEYNKLCQPGVDDKCHQRLKLIADLMHEYPASDLVDTYFMLPPYVKNLEERERILRLALEANPKQLFMVAMLADVLVEQQRFSEADQLMRQHYVGESMPPSALNSWPSYYAYNLMMWGRYELMQGNHARALSLLDYALRLNARYRMVFVMPYRGGARPWDQFGGVKPRLSRILSMATSDLRLLRIMGIQPDDRWQQPASPGKRPALYRSVISK